MPIIIIIISFAKIKLYVGASSIKKLNALRKKYVLCENKNE